MARRDFITLQASPPTEDATLAKWLSTLNYNLNLLAGLGGDSINYAVLKGEVTGLSAPAPVTGVAATDIANLNATLTALIQALQSLP